MTTAESVFRRSRELDNPPYSATLHFDGFEVSLDVYGVISDSGNRLKTDVAATDALIATEDIPTTTQGSLPDSEEQTVLSQVQTEAVATEITETFHPSVESQHCVFQYNGNEYLVEARGRRVFSATLEDSTVEVTLVSELNRTPPIETHIPNRTGELNESDGYFTFTPKPKGLLERVFTTVNLPELYFTLREPRNCFTLSDLDADEVVITTSSTVQFESCEFITTDDSLTVKISSDGVETSWTWELDSFGRLPETVQEQINLDDLYPKIENEQTVFVKFESVDEFYSETALVSDDERWELKEFE